jgi:hypothetical protein
MQKTDLLAARFEAKPPPCAALVTMGIPISFAKRPNHFQSLSWPEYRRERVSGDITVLKAVWLVAGQPCGKLIRVYEMAVRNCLRNSALEAHSRMTTQAHHSAKSCTCTRGSICSKARKYEGLRMKHKAALPAQSSVQSPEV